MPICAPVKETAFETATAHPVVSAPDIEVQIAEAARFTRRHLIASIYRATSGHPGGALSCADILATLFGAELNVWPSSVNDPQRDRFVLSKGHACPTLYAIAAWHGFCDKKESLNLRKLGSPFQGHPHVKDLPWVETSTGSLGQGFSVAMGMAMGLRMQKIRARVYTLLGDGEMQEGSVWETAMCSAHHKLDNLCAIIDYNKMQSDALNEEICGIAPLADKWRAFGWEVFEIDGHDIPQILSTFHRAATTRGKPSCIIANTIKGKGVPYMEGSPAWHGSVKLSHEQAETALQALGCTAEEIKEFLDV
ncbi:transketolase [Rhizomicrobium electricum]|jgi:transketolase|uniref:Transketolase n=1 Tax=Rhizomicrobium electricum TaxID=480070 RepID=A0ABN1FC41_9PROT|nr:transketolase [Rhizomicrobium electricum]NIJ50803.1 transketolase [Rhizomicrobium electricum]